MRNLSLYINCNCQLVENDDDEDVHQLRRRQSTSTTTIQSRRRHVVMQFARKQVNVRHILDKLDPSQQLLLNPMFQILNAILILIFGYLTVHNALRTKY